MRHKYKIDQEVVYDGLVARVTEYRNTPEGALFYTLVSVEDATLTTTAPEEECTPYNGETLDQSDRLKEARIDTATINDIINRTTSKDFSDDNT